MTQRWHDAAALSAQVHEHQYRRDAVTPYAAHPTRVALIIACVFGITDPDVIAAALLHDTIEDGPTDYDDLMDRFGKRVADLVACVTKDMRMIEPEREVAYDKQLADGPWEGRLIKLADVFDNLSDADRNKDVSSMIGKAERALALAAGDAELASACEHVRALIRERSRNTSGG